MCFHGQKTQPTLISGDKMSEAGTDKTLPILEQVIENHQNLPWLQLHPLHLSVRRPTQCCAKALNIMNTLASTDKWLDYLQ